MTTPKKTKWIFRILACTGFLALGFGAALALGEETPPAEAQDETHAWYFLPSVLPPPTDNGSAIITLNTVNDQGDEFARHPDGIRVSFLFLGWDITTADLGPNPVQGLNAAVLANNDTLGFFQARVHSANETISYSFPHRVVNAQGDVETVTSIVMVVPDTEDVVAMDFYGHIVRWSPVLVNNLLLHAWANTDDATIKAGEAPESTTKPNEA